MKNLYRKGTVHPSPPPITDPLSFLPAAIFTLAAALTDEDREVLAYLLSCSSSSVINNQSLNKKKGVNHPADFNCDCFRCYMSFWVRWDSSPNRELIHEIIEAFEDSIVVKNRGRRERRKKGVSGRDEPDIDRVSDVGFGHGELGMLEPVEEGELQGGPVRKMINFIGERIWNVWG